MSKTPPPLLRRASLLPGESLASLLVRLAKLNHYDSFRTIQRLCLEGLEKDRLDRPLKTTTYQRIAALTKLDPADLYPATAHRFAHMLTPPGVELEFLDLLGGEVVPVLAQRIATKQLHPNTAVQFCPLCLQDAAYYRLIWMPVAVTTCLVHRCLLLNACPNCQNKVAIGNIVNRRCPHCRVDLSQVRVVSIVADTLGLLAQQVIQTWLMSGVTVRQASSELPEQPPSVLFQVLSNLCTTMLTLDPDWPYFHPSCLTWRPFAAHQTRRFKQATPAHRHVLHTTAFKVLTSWPDQFYQFLHALRFREGVFSPRPLSIDFPYLYQRFLEGHWQHPAFQFVQDSFNQYLFDHYPRAYAIVNSRRYRKLANRFTFMTVFDAGQFIHEPAYFVRRLIERGELTGYPPQDERFPYPFVAQADVLAWYRQHRLISVSETARQMGLSSAVVLNLVKARLLEAENDPRVGQNYLGYIRQPSIKWLRRNLATYLFYPHGPMIDWATATQMFAKLGLNEAAIFQCVLGRWLRCFAPIYYPPDLSTLLFDPSELKALIAKIQAQLSHTQKDPSALSDYPLIYTLFPD